jgi:hypothetical protein
MTITSFWPFDFIWPMSRHGAELTVGRERFAFHQRPDVDFYVNTRIVTRADGKVEEEIVDYDADKCWQITLVQRDGWVYPVCDGKHTRGRMQITLSLS